MNRQREQRAVGWLTMLVVMTSLSLGWLWHQSISVAEESTSKDRRSSSSGSQGKSGDLSHLESKLDQVLGNQQTILKKFDEVMDELRIIKVRATLR